ncbi:MAG: glutaminyl-peptide cyclotransferase [Bacteroidetes bacterium]|nr:glutaminyl-peptide cyclotransferase [Bacteroidota bacterium]
MRQLLSLLILTIFLVQCGTSPKVDSAFFEILIKADQKTYTPLDTLHLAVLTKLTLKADSIQWSAQSLSMGTVQVEGETLSLNDWPMGNHKLQALVYTTEGAKKISKEFTVVAAQKPELYTYTILERFPHDINAYTQGLEFDGDDLYESTGQYGQSSLRKLDLIQGKVLRNEPLDHSFFAEGLTVFDNKIIQLTWRENTGLVYNKETLELIDQFQYDKSLQGWGLCNDGTLLYKSDGTQKIWRIDPKTYKELGYIEVYTDKLKIDQINELEWVDGKIYANIYQKDAIAIVDPQSGAVEGVINLKGLQKEVTQHQKLDVLNGIAYNGIPGELFITGKNWDQIFKLKVDKKQ